MAKLAAVVLSLLMVSGTVMLLPDPPEGTGHVAGADLATPEPSLVPPAPGLGYTHPEPEQPLNRSRHPSKPSPAMAVTGSTPLLVILIKFTDTTNSSTHTPTYFNNLVFNASANSVNKFYKDNSYGVFCITGNVTTVFYTATHNMSWYGRYETYSSPPGGFGNAQNLTYDAVMAANADINYADYDGDGDGWVDHLLIVHAGADEAYTGVTDDIWSHAWAMKQPLQLDGKYLYYYTMLSENDPVGVYVHEFGHDLGLPDIYDTDYSSDGGVGMWDVMASGSWNNGGNTPSQLSAWCKQELGWLSPTLVTADTAGIAAKRVEDNSSGAVYKVWVNFSNNEYFLIENRQQTGWDAALPGNGLLIWHINESATGNSKDSYRLVDLEEADNNNHASDAGDAWKSSATGITTATSPNTNDYSGKSTGIRIFNISASGNTMYFDVALSNVAPNAPSPTSPADGAWTNNSKPVLNWSFSDSNPGDTQTAYRVQVDDSSAFGSVNWDSGDTTSAANGTAVGSSLAEGKWYWRVRTRDSGGVWGAYNSATVRSVNIDLTAPAAPLSPTATPASWTATNSFNLDWTNPSESGTSGIATGAYYKLDNAPTGPTDGTWTAAKPLASITVSGAGTHTIYLWLKDNVGNLNYVNRASAYLYFDNVAPSNPSSLSSSSHTVSGWSNKSAIQAQWSGASDSHSGLAGYSFLWDGSPSTLPDNVMECNYLVSGNTSAPFSDGTYYFHIRTVDNVSNWAASAAHLGPFYIDLTAPAAPLSPTATPASWTATNSFTLDWTNPSESGTSGIATGAYYKLDNAPTSPTDGTWIAAKPLASITVSGAGTHTIYLWLKDNVGNLNYVNRASAYLYFDNVAPSNPSSLSSSSHTVSGWSNKNAIQVQWSGASDSHSGLAGYSFLWDGSPSTLPDNAMDCNSFTSSTTSAAFSDGTYYFHIRAVDGVSNWAASAAHLGPFYIDLTAPAAPLSPKATPAAWTATNSFTLDWTNPSESGTSGIATGAYYKLDNAPTSSTDGTWIAAKPLVSITVSGAGTHTIYLWLKDNVGNLNYINRSATYLYFDNVAPSNPSSLSSSSHTVSGWSNKSAIQAQWSGASDSHSGLAGYSFLWDGSPSTLPDNVMECNYSVSGNTSAPFSDGTYYFHIRTVDNVSNWAASAVHLGPFYIDLTPPRGVLGASSSTHSPRIWSPQNTITVQWWGAADAGSGLGAYSIVWDRRPNTLPDMTDEVLSPGNSTQSPPLPDYNSCYIHVRVRDATGNWNATAFHYGPFAIDTVPPANPFSFVSPTGHHVGGWSAERVIGVIWAGQGDSMSGVHGYSIHWDTSELTVPDTTEDLVSMSWSFCNAPGSRVFLHIRTCDVAGNWNASAFHIGPFLIDWDGPSTVTPIPGAKLVRTATIGWSWAAAADNGSGVGGYQVQAVLDKDHPELGALGFTIANSYVFAGAADGRTYYLRARAVDNVGNYGDWGPFSEGMLVDQSPPRGLSIALNGGEGLTSSPNLTLALSAEDEVSGVADMRFSQDGRSWTDWTAFASSASLELTTGDGQRPVYFQARDLAGNEATPARAVITLDTVGPAIRLVEMAGGAGPANGRAIEVGVVAADALSVVAQVRLGSDGKSWGDWQPYGELLPWELSEGDGQKDVYAQARDAAGNIGPAAKFTVTLDTTAPAKPTISSTTHPMSDTWYNSPTLKLRWTVAEDASGIAGYCYILTPDAADQPGERVVLGSNELSVPVPGEGRWHFKVRAVDGAGNWGDIADFVMLFDLKGATPPPPLSPADGSVSLPGTMLLAWGIGNDSQSGVKGYQVQVDTSPDFASPTFEGAVEGTSYTTQDLGEGDYYWHVKALDGAGNWGEYGSTSIFLLRNPVPPEPEKPSPLLDLSNRMVLLVLGVLLLAIIVGAAAAVARRRKKRPPAVVTAPVAQEQAAVVWNEPAAVSWDR